MDSLKVEKANLFGVSSSVERKAGIIVRQNEELEDSLSTQAAGNESLAFLVSQ